MTPTTISATPCNSSWQRLPGELRNAIVEALLHTEGSLAPFASVSREWQTIIEPRPFSRITLRPGTRLVEFDSMTRRNRALVRYIWFSVELETYDCTHCEPSSHDTDDCSLSHEDNLRIVYGLEALFTTLSTWEPRPCGDMLQLDISVHSPSDSGHWFKYLTFEPDLSPEECASPLVPPEYEDHKHGWRAGRQVSLPTSLAVEKTFGEIMDAGPFENEAQDEEWWGQLPLVPVVTSLLLRQQSRRRWKPCALALLFSHFPNLSEIHYEPWREWSDFMQNDTDLRFQNLVSFLPAALKKLRRLFLFENFVPDYAIANATTCRPSRIASPLVSHAVSFASLKLEQLSASFIVDAGQFFDCACKNTSWVWANLTSIALATRLFGSEQGLRATEDPLRNAATTAMRMPKLETLELWNGGKGSAMLFRYQRQPHAPGTRTPPSAVILWRGTWSRKVILHLWHCVADAWTAVARRHGILAGTIVQEVLNSRDAAMIRSHGDAMHHLNLSSSIIRPISLQQIRTEQMIRDRRYD